MKRTLFFMACVLASLTMSAQDDLTVGDIQNSGCLRETRGEGSEPLPTIVLTKEGSVLSVQLLNYESVCGTSDFKVTPTVNDGKDGDPLSVSISVVPYIYGDELPDCYCPYNVSFTVHDWEAKSFYLSCWWYEGLVTLEEGKPLVLEDIYEEATIDGMKYTLRKAMGRALLADGSTQKGEVTIPSKLNYEGNTYQVIGISFSAFNDNKNLTKVIIPKTIKNMDLSNNIGIGSNPFSGCTALQSIEVEEGNPAVCSVDGVLFNKGKDKLISYPAGKSQTSYTVPESVTWIEGLAFSYSQHLRKVTLTDNVTALGYSAFYESKSLEEVRLPSRLKILANYLFGNCQRLKSVTIPQDVTYLGLKAFENCTSLTSVTMPESITSTGNSVFEGCKSLESVTLSPKLGRIGNNMFSNCSSLKELLIPNGVTMVGSEVFKNCSALTSLDLPESVNGLGSMVFAGCKLSSLYIRGVIDSQWMYPNVFRDMDTNTKLYVKPSEVEKFKVIYNGPVYPLPEQTIDDVPYRPFVEDGKVWKVGGDESGNPVKLVEYYYFDGDTIIDGKTCKRMMCQRYVNPDYADYDNVMKYYPLLSYMGAWYEEDQKVYFFSARDEQFTLWYDFSLDANDSLRFYDVSFVIGPRQTGGIKGFKGVYREVEYSSHPVYKSTWLEGVGNIIGPIRSDYFGKEGHSQFLMSCTVGDEVIYLNDEYEDGATPEAARKQRIDFTHTIKTRPKSRMLREEAEQTLYGEYNDQQLGINLDPLDDSYLVQITDETGKAVYEKTVNAGNIVGLNIDISDYAEGRYIVTVENSNESFTAQFDTHTTEIVEVRRKREEGNDCIYNLQGQRLTQQPRKGVYIRDGRKIVVK